MADQRQQATAPDKMLTITRVFDAPRELVFEAWTRPEHLMQWWGPKGFTCPVYKSDLRVGGKYHGVMRSPEGQEFWSAGEYLEIDPPKKIVAKDHFADADGNMIDPSTFGFSPDFPKEMVVTATFRDLGDGRTELTIYQTLPLEIARSMQADVGWAQSLDKLEALLAALQST